MGGRLLVITECYPRPRGMHRCAFAHRQLVGAKHVGWDIKVAVPNGWYPPLAWRIARSWRQVRAGSLPDDWQVDGIPVRDLPYENRLPGRWFGRRPLRERIARATVAEVGRRRPDVVMVQF